MFGLNILRASPFKMRYEREKIYHKFRMGKTLRKKEKEIVNE